MANDPPATPVPDDAVDTLEPEQHDVEPEASDDTVAGRGPTSLRRAYLRGVVHTYIGALLCAFILDGAELWGHQSTWWKSTFLSPAFFADSLVIWLVIVVAVGLTNRVWTVIGVLLALCGVIVIANRIKLSTRLEPIYPSDTDFLTEPGFLTTMVSPKMLVFAGIGIVAFIGLALWLGNRFERPLPPVWLTHLSLRKQWLAVCVRAGVVTLAMALLADTTNFNNPGNMWRALYELDGPRWRSWNQATNYLTNGFVGGFLYNMPVQAMSEPEGYSEATVDRVARRYENLATRINKHRDGSLDDVNVVFILSESFSDPDRLKGVKLATDPIPRVKATMKQTTSGTMLPQLYGGGTANMEFETLTGQSVGLFAPQLQSPYQMLVSDESAYPSAVGWFKHQGHTPIAVHPFNTGMYKRQTVYRTFGFSDFVHDTTMAEQEHIDDGHYISDKAAFDEVEHQIADHSEPLMVNLVTMQNHIPVNGEYHNPIPAQVAGGDDNDKVGMYARGIAHTDVAISRFLEHLKKSHEKTLLVFYGDHLPGIYNSQVREQNPDGIYRTPFFVWKSWGANKHRPIKLVSPIQFMPLMYQVADAPVPPFFALLQRFRHYVGALEQGKMYRPDGQLITEDELSPQGQKVLHDLRLTQYDFSIGQRYALERMWPGALRSD